MTNPICPDCGNEEDQIVLDDGDSFYHCWHCEANRQAERELYFDEVNEPMDAEEAFHDMRRVDWEREVYRRADEDDRLTRQDDDDLLDNLADWNDEPDEE